MRYYVTLPGGDEVAVDLTVLPNGQTSACVDGVPIAVDSVELGGATNVRVGDRVFDLWLENDGDTIGFVGSGHRARARVETDRSRIASVASRSQGASGGAVVAPMPGRVVKYLVAVGDSVERDSPIVVVEAMKMENELCAERPGVVTELCTAVGENVESGKVLVVLGPVVLGAPGAEQAADPD